EFAHKHNVTKIVAGKPARPRWFESMQGSILNQIIHRSGSIDVYVISDTSGPIPGNPAGRWIPRSDYRRYLYSVLIVAGVTLAALLMRGLFHPVNLVMLYLAAVVVCAVYFGRGPSILASSLGVLAFDFFFIDPRLTFTVFDTQYVLTFIVLQVVGLVISNLTARGRDQMEALQKRQEQTHTLFSLSRELTTAVGMDTVLNTVIDHTRQTLGRDAAIFLPVQGKLDLRATSPGFILDEHERAVAVWAFDHGQPTGRGTETLPAASMRFQPLKTTRGTLGVLGIKPEDPNSYLNPEQRQLLEAYTGLAAVAIERALLDDQAREAQVLRESERLQTALLNSISHDLRTPLASIRGALDSLLEAEQGGEGPDPVHLDPEARLDLIQTAREETHRLNRLVGNLLDMTRLEAGTLRLHREESDVQDLIGAAVSHLHERLRQRPVSVRLPDDLPAAWLDFPLVEQVLVNLLDNAIKYSPEGTPIEIHARVSGDQLEISMADRGIGIPESDLEHVFEKFYRIQRPESSQGTGLGLSICRGIVEAHGGRIRAYNRPGGGTLIRFTLPLNPPENGPGKDDHEH
ncbi:MAG: sensor histidine kinase KdpD, partial [Chloroflexi bacterium]|nr:sensor histidine kinase KdpD [Chloroflexota bacterium]